MQEVGLTAPLRAVRALAAAQSPDSADYLELRRYLTRQVLRRSGVSSVEAEDVVDEALARFIAVARRGEVEVSRAMPYLNRIARNESIDRRRRKREELVDSFDDQPLSDDEIARLVDKDATAVLLEAALSAAVRRGDAVCTRVATEWLREAAQQAGTPSSREVARRAGVSHVTVQHCLKRLRDYIHEVTADFPDQPELDRS